MEKAENIMQNKPEGREVEYREALEICERLGLTEEEMKKIKLEEINGGIYSGRVEELSLAFRGHEIVLDRSSGFRDREYKYYCLIDGKELSIDDAKKTYKKFEELFRVHTLLNLPENRESSYRNSDEEKKKRKEWEEEGEKRSKQFRQEEKEKADKDKIKQDELHEKTKDLLAEVLK